MKIEYCPYCNGKKFVEGKHSGYAEVYGEGLFSSSPLYHQICLKCGSVVRSYVKDPQILLKKKNRTTNEFDLNQ